MTANTTGTSPNTNQSGPCNRWERAYAVLQTSKDSKKCIAQYERILSQEILNDQDAPLLAAMKTKECQQQVSALAHKKLEEAERSRSELHYPIDRIIKSVLFFKDFVSSAVICEPHAALAWAGVCIFLPIVLNQTQQRQALAEGVDQISDLCCRYFVIEHTYEEQKACFPRVKLTDLEQRFDLAIVTLYSGILNYQARIICQLSHSRISQNMLNIVKHNDWKELLGEITKADSRCQEYIKVLDSATLNTSFDYQREAVDELLEQHFDLLNNRLDAERRAKCISTFRTSDYERHKNRIAKRVENTCNWVLEHSSYRRWYDSKSDDLLWITAYPGCGKTVLSKFLVEHVFASQGWNVCYFFFNETVEEQSSASNALCALLHQLFVNNPYLHTNALATVDRDGAGLKTTYSGLWSVFETTIMDPRAGNVICIIDAIDECALEEYRGKKRIPLLESLMDFFRLRPKWASCSRSIKFLLTSRPYQYIENQFEGGGGRCTRLAGENESAIISQEIDIAIKERVREMRKLSLETKLKLEKKLLETRSRTYLWLTLVLDEIEEATIRNERKLLRLVEEPPRTVDAAYDSILSRSSDRRDQVIRLLHIVIAAVRPLTLQEIDVALAAEWGTTDHEELELEEDNIAAYIHDLCGIITVDQVHSQVFLIHQTAKTFLMQANGIAPTGSWKHSVDVKMSHQVLAEICLTYLFLDLFDDDPDGRDPLQKDVKEAYLKFGRVIARRTAQRIRQNYQFLDYSGSHWAHHSCQAQSMGSDSKALGVALQLCDVESFRFSMWFLVYHTAFEDELKWLADERNDFAGITNLMVAVLLGWEGLAMAMISNGADLDTQDAKSRTALQFAVRLASETIARDLLANGACVDTRDDFGNTPLHYAVWGGQEKIVKLLLGYGADVDAKDRFHTTPLQNAALHGRHNILTQLLNHGADVNVKDHRGSTAFHMAVERNDRTAVDLLLPYTSVDVKGKWGMTALHEAARRSYPEMVRVLLDHGANPEAQDAASRTPLHVAVNVQWTERVKSTVQLLIQHGAVINAIDEEGHTAYIIAQEIQGNGIFLGEITNLLSLRRT